MLLVSQFPGFKFSFFFRESTSRDSWCSQKQQRMHVAVKRAAAVLWLAPPLSSTTICSAYPLYTKGKRRTTSLLRQQLYCNVRPEAVIRNAKTWQRLRHVVHLATQLTSSSSSIVDVGTDHGLLAASLAATGNFERVLGVDISFRALQDGALSMLQTKQKSQSSVVQLQQPCFRQSNGLENVQVGEADTVVIAGMGVVTMMRDILLPSQLQRLDTQQLILQPTNCKPAHLMQLYNYLFDDEWRVQDERIEFLSQRWYITTLFGKRNQDYHHHDDDETMLPGHCLLDDKTGDDEQHDVFVRYIRHHCNWMRQDARKPGNSRMVNNDNNAWMRHFERHAQARQ